MAQEKNKLTTSLVYWSKRFKSKRKEMAISEYFSSFSNAAASAADPARKLLIY